MKIRARYKTNKDSKIGDKCVCPSCGTEFVKTNYQQAFCKTQYGTQCKDKYWNTVIPEKRCNTTRISPASQRFLERKREIDLCSGHPDLDESDSPFFMSFDQDEYEHSFGGDKQ